MTNFIYIFMIIALIGIGVDIKAFNSEDSDTKTNVKNIPRGLKKVLLIGKNVHKTDIVMLIGIIIYLLFTVGVTGIYLSASHKLKVDLQYILCLAFLVILFLEIFIIYYVFVQIALFILAQKHCQFAKAWILTLDEPRK